MFDLSFTEMLLAGAVALVVLGPERLPTVARSIGNWAGKIQRFSANIKNELASQSQYGDLMKLKDDVHLAAQNIRTEINEVEQQIKKEGQEINQLAQPVVDTRPAWDRLPEQRTPADFGINTHATTAKNPAKIGFHTPSLRQQALQRKRDARPRPRSQPKFRSKK